MKRFISSILPILILSAFALNGHAAKANSRPMTYPQPDSTSVTVTLHGDEHFSWYTTVDGILLYPVGSHFFIARTDDNGNIHPTNILAHDNGMRCEEEILAANDQRRELFYQTAEATHRMAVKKQERLGNSDYVPHTGSPKIVVIPVEFTDVKFTLTNPQVSLDQMFNGEGTLQDLGHGENTNFGSVRRYFSDMSDGLFTPEFQVLNPVTLSREMKYYGGSNASSPNDERPGEVMSEALALVVDQVDFNLPEYDLNNDGKVDCLYIVYAGYGQNSGGPAESIWARSSTSTVKTPDGKAFSRYAMSSELNHYAAYWEGRRMAPQINGIGVVCHEFSHTMGLPDLYPTVSSAYCDNQEMEYWDLMDGGEYVQNGYRPTAYTAWERMVMGWKDMATLTETKENVQATPLLDGGTAYRILNEADEDEYFVLENIQKIGWNASLPGHGLLVYHVKYPYSTVSYTDHPNNTANKPGIAVVPADGTLACFYLVGKETSWGTGQKTDSNGNIISNHIATSSDYHYQHQGDPFPGTSKVHQLTFEQDLPNFQWYTEGPNPKKALYDIAEDATTGIVTFQYSHDGVYSAISSVNTVSQPQAPVYSLDGRRVEKENIGKGVYIIGERKIVIQ